jgi:uncharacterized membrane protein
MKRPRINIELMLFDYIIEAMSLLFVTATIVAFILCWVMLPEIVPIHYNLAGEADGFGSKTENIVLPLMGVFTYVGLTVLNRYPHIFNYPVEVTEENASYLYRTAKRMIRSLKLLFCLLMFCLVVHQLFVVTNHHAERAMNILINIFIVSLIILPVYYNIRYRWRKKSTVKV